MIWLAILKGLVTLANWIASACHDQKLLDAGQYEAIAKNNSETLDHIAKAQIARAAASQWPTPEQLHDDPDNTDKRS